MRRGSGNRDLYARVQIIVTVRNLLLPEGLEAAFAPSFVFEFLDSLG